MSVGEILLRRLPHAADLPPPAYATAGAAGFDLRAAIDGEITLAPGTRVLAPTGFCFAVPAGWEIQVRPRSGLAAKHGVTLLNTPGTIDSDYRGEVFVCLINLGKEAFIIRRGDRIAQAVAAPAPQWRLREVAALDDTARGAGGFGSTGVG
ncbi:dUTP diphosphatase [Camelimonas lactis]|uniref:Deoxyuridine 5'-triphosphate nucleotidohydrolase n=1 Tax=Camelimonas lactis TaxID=659006 RepID=A0A4R2GXH9_9HYPH|nr:dUTP diphosphatase [Camelimonas lactis]TCO15949.1 dUTP pyrophosphatase [Camelimonas lactis]